MLRYKGYANSRIDKRELARLGIGKDNVIPAKTKSKIVNGYFGAKNYRISPPIRPKINFDNGFLDDYKTRKPTASDYLALAKWKAKLSAASLLRPDLSDAVDAYNHFLNGMGKTRYFSYDDYVLNDVSGRKTLANAMLDIQDAVETLYKLYDKPREFQLTGGLIQCGEGTQLFPYPRTENWQKTIGGHVIWLSGNVKVLFLDDPYVWFELDMTLHAEDRYNFNPGSYDVATDIPDEDNGRFEITGLAHQFNQYSTLKRKLKWMRGTLGKPHLSQVTYQRA